jgi:serralysin
MTNLIGGNAPYRGLHNLIIGTADADFIFGDPFTTGNTLGVPQIGGPLAAGRGGNDRLIGLDGDDRLFGDAWEISGEGRGGKDWLGAGQGDDTLFGDANFMADHDWRANSPA